MDREAYLGQWASAHGGVGLSVLVRGWLRLIHTLAAPVARARVRADAVTLLGPAVATLGLWPAHARGRWALLAAACAVLAGVLDGVDGAVAALASTASRWGALLDSACDRLADLALVGLLLMLGCPVPLAAGAAVVGWWHEYLRARGQGLGLASVGVVTVGERPTRVIIVVMFCAGAGTFPAGTAMWATAGGGALVLMGIAGATQLLVSLRRRLR